MELAVCENTVYIKEETHLFTRYVEANIVINEIQEKDLFTWKKAKIPYSLWEAIVSFMKWSQKEFKSEAHCSLFYNLAEDKWDAWAFPQETNGMTVKLLPDDPLYKEQRQQFKADWILAGSVHHHCEMGAFQSGTDSSDECAKDGVHVTVGKTSSDRVELHVRKTLEGTTVTCRIEEFFENPIWQGHVPKGVLSEVVCYHGYIKDRPFPEEWRHNVRRPTFQMANQPGTGLLAKHQGTLIGRGLINPVLRGPVHHEAFIPETAKPDPLLRASADMLDKIDDQLIECAAYLQCQPKEAANLWLAFINGKKLCEEELGAAKLIQEGLTKTGLRNKTIKAYITFTK